MKRACVLFLTTILLINCGTRKRVLEKSKTEELNVVEKDIKIDESTSNTFNFNVKTEFEELVFEPIKPNFPMIIGGKEYKNTRIKRKKEKKEDKTVHLVETDKIISDKSKSEKLVKIESKKVDLKRDNTVGSYIWILVFLILVIIISYVLKKKGIL